MPNAKLAAIRTTAEPENDLIEAVDSFRADAFGRTHPDSRSKLGQFPTPVNIATFMASLFANPCPQHVRLLDPGAGVGSLTAAYVQEIAGRRNRPKSLHVVAYDIEPAFADYLQQTLELSRARCGACGIAFTSEVRNVDFIADAAGKLTGGLFGRNAEKFNAAILNPPYKKINTDSAHRRHLREVGVETSNLYTAFLSLVTLLLDPDGELVAITPRSFCNGPYFKPFRDLFLREMSIRQVHVFHSRKDAFAEDEVLQENIILKTTKSHTPPKRVLISSSHGPEEKPEVREIDPSELVRPDDPEKFIHLLADDSAFQAADLIGKLTATLEDTGLQVSTGRLVDFRSRQWLRSDPGPGTVPLIYPAHFESGWIKWPKSAHKKPNACALNDDSAKWLIPAAVHVLTKRFSAKEERRRIVAAIFDPARVPCRLVAFENHVNYYHQSGTGLPMQLARGLNVFLNSTLVDKYFRNFNGHTQVNATDLRNLKYPTRAQLEQLGSNVGDELPEQDGIDQLVAKELFGNGSG